MCAGCALACSGGLEEKAPEEQDAQDYQDRNDDDLNQTHGRSSCRKTQLLQGAILVASMGHVNRALAANCRATEKHLCWFTDHGSEV